MINFLLSKKENQKYMVTIPSALLAVLRETTVSLFFKKLMTGGSVGKNPKCPDSVGTASELEGKVAVLAVLQNRILLPVSFRK